jgi:hypothetical protein
MNRTQVWILSQAYDSTAKINFGVILTDDAKRKHQAEARIVDPSVLDGRGRARRDPATASGFKEAGQGLPRVPDRVVGAD